MARTPITTADLEVHLDEQLGFLERSAAAFDSGYQDEAKRLAVTIRVLLHETPNSHSLLGQLGRRQGDFLDTALPADSANILTHGGLVSIALGPRTTRYVAMLDDVPVVRQVTFDEWWDAPVFIDSNRKSLSRKQLITITANQDGGAHVDPALDETYTKLTKQNSLNWVVIEDGMAKPLDGPQRAAIRQIAHEVLKTLKPDYAKIPLHPASVIVGGISMTAGEPPGGIGRPPTANPSNRKIGRNEPCPCGSTKKYKKCCGSYFASHKT